MSEFKVEVVLIREVRKHENADTLSITDVHGGYPVVIRTGEFNQGDLAIYIPVDALLPVGDARWEFLSKSSTPKVIDGKSYYRLKAAKLRGVFSMGLLVKPVPLAYEGEDVARQLDVLKYEPPEPMEMNGENERDPGILPGYDIEGLRRWPGILIDGEEVAITEKVHGACSRFVWHDGRPWVASHHAFKRPPEEGKPETIWWRVARQERLFSSLQTMPDVAFYGEVYGQVQDLRYGVTQQGGLRLAFFDAWDVTMKRWLDHDGFVATCRQLGLPMVPLLYEGPWRPDLVKLAEGQSQIVGAPHVREGFVVRPKREREVPGPAGPGRVILKYHGEGFLTRKERP